MLPLWIQFSMSKEHQAKTKMNFNLKFGFPGIIGAIDCTHVAIVTPNDSQEYQSFIYMNRKSFYSINVHLICDVNMRILNINEKYPGTTHDAFIWRHSAIRNALLANNEAGSWLIGDAAYPLEPWLMTPISNADDPDSTHGKSLPSNAGLMVGKRVLQGEAWSDLSDSRGTHDLGDKLGDHFGDLATNRLFSKMQPFSRYFY
ncbi:Putative nuclease HARBI1 [Araneus ventricosus]|uniref:Nuclease HARBI1 n=1 Tax=Araneus ventricosus TaxID=182803 RepID=A0A4Y2EID1_ARAVE|nr:Putative nuclease HARBI1 [Araneus ventricosus]